MIHKIILLSSIVFISISAEVRLVLTCALVNNYYEVRKKQYINNFKMLTGYGFQNFYIIEAVKKKGPTFLNEFSDNVFYAQTNNPYAKNHGGNECRTLLEGLLHFNFAPDDIIIKFTGRYAFNSNEFFELVKNNPDYDVFIKKFSYAPGIFTACFAMKCKYLIKMLENIDYTIMDSNKSYLESEVEKYIKEQKELKIFWVNKFNIKAEMIGSSNDPSLGNIIWEF